jgi:hypothetical protein
MKPEAVVAHWNKVILAASDTNGIIPSLAIYNFNAVNVGSFFVALISSQASAPIFKNIIHGIVFLHIPANLVSFHVNSSFSFSIVQNRLHFKIGVLPAN